jgi:uncharacterized protein YjeT (DUF2065 family)
MELSILLFRLFGFLWVIIGGAYIFRHEHIRATLQDFYKNYALITIVGILNIVLGLLIALNFTHWEFNAKGFITLIAYLMILKGILHLYYPAWGKAMAESISRKNKLSLIGAIFILVGLWLLYEGFYY